jgi:autotransporter-associated beta strand protein
LPGATFDVYGLLEGEPVVASGTGMNGIGAIINTGGDSLQALGQLTLSGDITINTAFRTDIRGNAAALSTSGHDYKLTKSGAGQFSIVYATVDPALGDIDVQAGIMDFEGTTTSMGNPANTISIAAGATLQFWNLLSPADKNLTLNGTFQSGLGVANTFVGPITLGAASKFDTINSSVLTLSGVISGDSTALTKTGDGTLILSAANHYTGATTVNAGILRVSGSVADSSQVVVNNSATFDAASTQKLTALSVNSGGSARVSGGTLKIGSGANALPLAIAATGSIDLTTHALIVDSPTGDETATLQMIRGQIISGYNHGDWLGKGIMSSAAAVDHDKAIGYARVSDVLTGGSDSLLGQSVDGTEIVARYTVAGDTNLDGVVSFADLVAVAQHYGTTLNDNVNAPSTFTDSWWTHGDLNYDGQVNFADLVIVAQNYGGGLADTGVAGASAQFEADLADISASLPEPTIGLAGAVFTALSLLRRRRGRA